MTRLASALLALGLTLSHPAAASEPDIAALSWQALTGSRQDQREALDTLVRRGRLDIAPSLILMMRIGGNHVAVADAFHRLTGEKVTTWRGAMLWQEARPEIVPHPSYYEMKLRWWASIDARFREFFAEGAANRDMRIRFEEITWGGVRVDGIPALDNPALIGATDADYLLDDDLVFGLEINGDARAYPLRILGWHEMANDVVGGVPVALAYCTLCGAGIVFETGVEGRETPFVFGSSGLLYRSNKLMFDRETRSLWNQFTGEPVGGPLAATGIRLPIRPVTITRWADWRARHPDSRVLSLETGYVRDYDPGVVYRDYFASPDLMFPTAVGDESRVARKEFIYGIRMPGGARAWPVAAFAAEPVINDRVGLRDVVLIGNAETRTVRAYDRAGRDFAPGTDGTVAGPGGAWAITEEALVGPEGERLTRLPGHISYWFAWDGYLGIGSTLYPD